MIDKSSVAESLQKLAKQVRESDPRGSDRLVLLSNAVQTGANADAWSRNDIHTMIAPESIVELYRNANNTRGVDWWISRIEIIRNTLIFLPIMVTWYGISQATEQYNRFISAAIQTGKLDPTNRFDLYQQPFLYLWQQRFGGTLPSYLTLSSIALADVGIVLFIVLLTFLAYYLSNRSITTKDQDAQRLRANLFHAITGAALSLNGQQQPQLTSGDNLEGVARQLDGMMRYLVGQLDTTSKETAKRLEQMATDTTKRFDQMARETTARFETMSKEITGQFSNSTNQTRAQLESIAQQLNQQLQEGRKHLTNMSALTSGLIETATQIQAASNALKTTNKSLTETIEKLVQPAETLLQQQTRLLQGVDESFKLLQTTSTTLSKFTGNQEAMTRSLAQSLNSLKLFTEKLDVASSAQTDFAKQYGTYLKQIEQTFAKQESLANLMSDATVRVKEALEEMQKGAVSLKSMAVDMNDLLHLQASVPTHPNLAGVQELASVIKLAAQEMKGGGTSIKSSADDLQRASQQLRSVLSSQNGHK